MIRMPHHDGLFRFSASAIQTRIPTTMLTQGIRHRIVHHPGFPATMHA